MTMMPYIIRRGRWPKYCSHISPIGNHLRLRRSPIKNLYRTLFAVPLLGLMVMPAYAQSPDTTSPEVMKDMAPDALREGIENRHPSAYYILAAKLFNEGERDDAVFWFYTGQLRYRTLLGCKPDLAPDQDPALFASLNETVGRPLNGYAFGDVDELGTTIEDVLEWDAEHPNGYVSKAECEQILTAERAGLGELREMITEKADEIRKQREENGLENR